MPEIIWTRVLGKIGNIICEQTQRMKEFAKREQMRKIAQDNLMVMIEV